jgi:hypothetical protein
MISFLNFLIVQRSKSIKSPLVFGPPKKNPFFLRRKFKEKGELDLVRLAEKAYDFLNASIRLPRLKAQSFMLLKHSALGSIEAWVKLSKKLSKLNVVVAREGVVLGASFVVNFVVVISVEVVLGGLVEVVLGGSVEVVLGDSVEVVFGDSVEVVFGDSVEVVLGDSVEVVLDRTVEVLLDRTVEVVLDGSVEVLLVGSVEVLLVGSVEVLLVGSVEESSVLPVELGSLPSVASRLESEDELGDELEAELSVSPSLAPFAKLAQTKRHTKYYESVWIKQNFSIATTENVFTGKCDQSKNCKKEEIHFNSSTSTFTRYFEKKQIQLIGREVKLWCFNRIDHALKYWIHDKQVMVTKPFASHYFKLQSFVCFVFSHFDPNFHKKSRK